MADRLALFTGGGFAASHAKTAHGILRYGDREVVAVVDAAHAETGLPATDAVRFGAGPLLDALASEAPL